MKLIVDPTMTCGPVKPMNAVNNGSVRARSDQTNGNFGDFAALRIPYARTVFGQSAGVGGNACVGV